MPSLADFTRPRSFTFTNPCTKHRPISLRSLSLIILGLALSCTLPAAEFPGATWKTKTPEEVGLSTAKLNAFKAYVGGRGCIIRHGYLVYSWGDYKKRGDVASACKPWFSTFLFKAIEDGKIASLDTKVSTFEPKLNTINPDLGYKDRGITFRHMANQISCYGVKEKPGTAFDYNDWQMALLFDTLFKKVYGATYGNVDATVLHPLLTNILHCEDNPTFLAFGSGDRPGRVGVSPRDFARFGLLYLNKGNWNGTQIISQAHAIMAVTSPVPNSIPRTTGKQAALIPSQRTIGSKVIPDNQAPHNGSYSWMWWINGLKSDGKRQWPDAPKDTYGAFGHGAPRAMWVMPSDDIIVSYNDTNLTDDSSWNKTNNAMKLVVAAIQSDTMTNTAPSVNAGSDQNISISSTATLYGSASDDGQPAALTLSWSKVSGPGSVTFAHASAASTAATFSATGTYVLRLSANDGALSTHDDVSITVQAASASGPLAGQVIVDPHNPRFMVRNQDLDKNGKLDPVYISGPGDPEGFLYRGTRNANGTRSGDQQALINKIIGTGANSMYMHIIHASTFGGDGDANATPFNTPNKPNSGLNEAILTQWEGWLTQLDKAGIVVHLFFYDDSIKISTKMGWPLNGGNLNSNEASFITQIVNRFKHHKNLVWVVMEEVEEMGSDYKPHAIKIAAAIHTADDHQHVIGVHKLNGLNFSDFAADPHIDQYLVQYNVDTAEKLHAGMLSAWNTANGKYSLNMAEAANYGTGANARHKDWAIALSGASVMRFEMMIADTPLNDLQDCGRLASFMASTNYNEMAPHDELKSGGTQYVLAAPGDSYIAYASALSGDIGLQGLQSGTYNLHWFDCTNGKTVQQNNIAVGAGTHSWSKPSTIGKELALWIKRSGDLNNPVNNGPNIGSMVISPSGTLIAPANIAISAEISDSDGTITAARLYINGQFTHEEHLAPWNWGSDDAALNNLAAGSYSIKITAVDNDGASTSKTQTVTIIKKDSPPPPPSGSLTVSIAGSQQAIPAANIHSYSTTQDKGEASTVDNGNGLHLQGNVWKSADLNYTITADTMIAFDLSVKDAGELTGIGFDTDNDHTNDLHASPSMFILAGSQGAVANMINGRQYFGSSVLIPVGQYYTGNINRLCFMGDDDANASTDTTFSNIRIYEKTSTPQPPVQNLVSNLSVSNGKHYQWFDAKVNEKAYIDRDYIITGLPSILQSATALRTANDDKQSNAAQKLVSFKVNQDAAVYVAYDNGNTTLESKWCNNAGGWEVQSIAIKTSLAGNDTRVMRRKFFKAGSTVTLNGNGGTSNTCSMYYVMVIPGTDSHPQPPQNIVSNLSVNTGKQYVWFDAAVNQKTYIDRDYKITGLPAVLQHATALRTANDDKQSNAAQKLVSFKVNQDAVVYVAYDNGNTTLESKWCNNAGGWAIQSIAIKTSLAGDDARVVRRKFFPAGSTVTLNGNGGTSNTCSNYYVMVADNAATSAVNN